MLKLLEILYLRCLQVFSDNLQSCHFPVYHSINSYIFLSKFSNFLVITSLENRLSKNLIIRLFLILFSIILSYYASFAILFIFSFASINPRCVHTFNVTPISECPIKYWSATSGISFLSRNKNRLYPSIIGSTLTFLRFFTICAKHS